jgi:hypothetical protein
LQESPRRVDFVRDPGVSSGGVLSEVEPVGEHKRVRRRRHHGDCDDKRGRADDAFFLEHLFLPV